LENNQSFKKQKQKQVQKQVLPQINKESEVFSFEKENNLSEIIQGKIFKFLNFNFNLLFSFILIY